MRRSLTTLAARGVAAAIVTGSLLAPRPAAADLAVGATAPAFTTQAAQGGDVTTFDLATALEKGPVVVYFYPKSFTSVCTAEAHAFSDHMDDYAKLGATVIGLSGDSIATQKDFSTKECRAKFPVGADQGLKIAKSYDAKSNYFVVSFASRTSYVVAPDGKIAYVLSSGNPNAHVDGTLAALRKLEAK